MLLRGSNVWQSSARSHLYRLSQIEAKEALAKLQETDGNKLSHVALIYTQELSLLPELYP
ncbi:MAG: hypothetical protein DSM106950_13120 [Stigonema ocellatum SAG 48.90 = DSM 106950]|nr:hypothetical protein [Stigonema ocellatum SAG 48.90 = DSM 106950]